MKLIIDIDDDVYKNAKNGSETSIDERMAIKAISNGTPRDEIMILTKKAYSELCLSAGKWYLYELQTIKTQGSNVDLINKQVVLDILSELNAINFYEAQDDSKETYYEIRKAIKDLPPVNPQEPKILDKIRAEILKIEVTPFKYCHDIKREALEIIDKYKAERSNKE